jgi:hypothetical protein
VESADTETLMTGGGGVIELLPLQAVNVVTPAKPRSVRQTEIARLMAPPHGSTIAMTRAKTASLKEIQRLQNAQWTCWPHRAAYPLKQERQTRKEAQNHVQTRCN